MAKKIKLISVFLSSLIVTTSISFQNHQIIKNISAESTVYSNLLCGNNFDLENFRTKILVQEKEILSSGDAASAEKFISETETEINKLKSDLYLSTHQMLEDDTNPDLYARYNDFFSDLYEAETIISTSAQKIKKQFPDIIFPQESNFAFSKEFTEKQSELVNKYYSNNSVPESSEIYIKLIELRKSQFQSSSYIDHTLKSTYATGYDFKDISDSLENIQKFIISVKNSGYDTTLLYAPSSESPEQIFNYYENNISELPDYITEAYFFGKQNELFRSTTSQTFAPCSITSYLYNSKLPVSTTVYSGTKIDRINTLDSISKFITCYYKKERSENCIETEQLICYIMQTLLEEDKNYWISSLLSDLEDAYIATSLELYAYTKDSITADELSQKYCEIKKSLGYNYPSGQTSDIEWIYKENLFSKPLFDTIKMSTSFDAIILHEQYNDKISSILKELVTSTPNQNVKKILNTANISDCATITDTDKLSASFINFISNTDSTTSEALKGDVNDDGVINTKDFIVLHKFILNALETSDTFSKENADLNSNNSIDIMDLRRLITLLSK